MKYVEELFIHVYSKKMRRRRRKMTKEGESIELEN